MNGHASLNRCYRHVWSEATQSWMVAPETARRAGKGGRARRVLQAVIGALASVALSGGISTLTHAQQAPPSATQLPVANAVARGQVNITQTNTANSAVMNVNQTSQSAVVNWNTFNVGQNAQVNFNQPNSSAVTLNRVLDNNPSQVWGRITAPGQVFISNANGVYFSPSASVDVGALTATTHNISDEDFMSGKRTFTRDGATGKVINEGQLRAALGSYVALLAPEVQNAGVIVAQAGTVALAAGDAIRLNFDPSQRLTGITTTPSTITSLVENKHAVLAPDGHIVLSAVAMNKLQAGVVKNNGRLEASSMVSKGGTIVLEGDDITLERSSQIEATGPKGGGIVLVGGDWQGSGDLSQATRVKMEEGAVINASATDNGDGGKVVLWTDVHNTNAVTQVDGAIYARGGTLSGDGGRIETSGHILNVNASQGDASAAHGAAGLWLFDPYNVTITSADANGSFASDSATSTDTWTPSAIGSSILNTTIVTKLNAGTNVEIATTGAGADAGNITVEAVIAANNTGTGNLSLLADGDISLNANINTGANLLLKAAGSISQLGSTTVNTNGGNVTYWSDSDSSGAGSISLLAGTSTNQTSIVTNGGHIVMGGGVNAASSAAMGVNGIRLDGFTMLNAGAGNVNLRGTSTSNTANGGVGLRLVNSTITGYDINLFGQGPANTGGSASGSATTTTLTATHNINLAADVFASGVNNHVTATATGSVVVNAAQTWGTNNLVLSAGTDVDLNADLDASSGGGLTVRYGQGSTDGGASAYRVNGVNVKIALPSGSGSKFRWKKGSAGANDNELVFNNGYLAFAPNASGTRTAPNTSALNEQGQLNQPNFYDLDTVNNVTVGRDAWYKLTFSNRSLEFQVGTGTSGTSWNTNNAYATPGGTGGYLDISQYLPGIGSGPGGGAKASGTILSVLPLTVSSQSAQLISRYVLGAGDAYLRSDTSVKSISSTLSNVGLWVGTGDDWVGGTDGPIKTIGNFSSTGFTANTVVGQSASVLRVDENNSTGASVLFYSTDSSASATFSSCCSFSNATGVNPANQTITQQNDGSYSLYTGLGDVTAGATKGFSWFYVAAPSQKVNAVAQSVVSTLTTYSFNGNSPSLTYAYTGNAYSLANLWSSVSLNTSGGSVMLQPGQATNGYSFVYSGNPVTSLTNAGTYRLQIALTSDIASNYLLNNVGAATLTITPAPLSISGTTAANKTYDSTNVATVTAGTLDPSGFLQGQTVGVSATGTFDNVNVGLRAVTPVYTLIDGTNGGLARNYAITNGTTTPAYITPANLTLSGTKVYDGLTSIAGSTLTARGVNNQTFSITGMGDLSNLANPNVQTNSLLTSVTGLSLGTSSNGGISSNYNAISFTGSTYSITPKALTVTGISVVDKVYNGGTQALLNTASATYTGMIAGDDLSMSTSAAVASFNNKNVGLAKPVTVSGLTLSGSDSANYTLTAPTSLTGNITRLSSVTWTGGATGNWFDPANWEDGAVPDLANVGNVIIPTGKTVSFGSTVVAPASAGTVQVDSINANSSQLGGLSMSAGTLEIGSGNANLYSLTHTGGAFSVASNLTITDAFSQTAAGTVAITGNATLTDTTGGVALGALTVGGALSLQSTGGGITQVSGTSILATGSSNFSARSSNAPASIVLAEAGNNFQGAVSADGSLVTLQDSNALSLGQIVATGNLTVTSGSHLTQTGPVQVDGSSALTATAGDITLANASNDFTGALTISAANISLRDANALPLATLTASGNTDIVTNGHITQTGPISIGGTTDITAGGGNVVLANASNDFIGVVSASGADINLRDVNTLTLAALTSTGQSTITTDGDVAFGTTSVRGNLSVISGNGNISQTQTMGVTGSASFNAGTGTVDLSNASNVFGATPQIQATTSVVSSGGPYNLASALGSDPQKPILSGMAPANTTVSVFDNGTLLGTTTADNAGAWNLVPTTFMVPGNHIITASSASAVGVSGLSSPLSILVNARFDTPNMVGAALQTQQSQASVAPPVIGGLQPGQSPVVHADQLSSMSTQQLQAMTPLQTSLLSPVQLSSLEPTQLASLSPSQFQALQPSQVSYLAPSQMVELSAQQVAAISSAASLSLDQLQVLAPSQVAAVQPSQFATMHAAQIASLGDAQLQALTPSQVAAIAPTQLAAFTPEQVSFMGPGLTQNLSPEQFGGLTALQLIGLSEAQVSAVSPAQLQQLNPMQLSAITSEQKAAMSPLQLLALGETNSFQVSALSPQDVSNFTAQQVQNLQPEHLQALSGLQIRGFTSEHIESMSFSQISSLSPVQLQALTSQQILSLSVAQAASLNDSQLAVMSASQLNALPKGGALPITVLGSASAPAASIEFEKRADAVEFRVSDMVPGGASSVGSDSMSTELTVFTVTTADNQTIEFKGAISNKQLMIAAPTEAAQALTRSDLAQIMKVALTQLGGDKAVDPTELNGIILDLRS
jgi:filamentous hemagglutinin family protein